MGGISKYMLVKILGLVGLIGLVVVFPWLIFLLMLVLAYGIIKANE